ncbi:YciI family protein [Brevibacterium sp.]|uniref:YciI family protein n=1 Tax=Brevibacterium sp. TaxID=1701 RepID=UPI0028124741|nr:YciI family protein [Brevibacterium sp.]
MKYVILIHSNPQPWGHPTGDYLAEHQALPQEEREAMNSNFEKLLGELQDRGELLGGEALGDPASSKLYRWKAGEPTSSDGPYAETKEHLAGFFIIDVDSPERAEEIADGFAGPGETVELRPIMWFRAAGSLWWRRSAGRCGDARGAGGSRRSCCSAGGLPDGQQSVHVT